MESLNTLNESHRVGSRVKCPLLNSRLEECFNNITQQYYLWILNGYLTPGYTALHKNAYNAAIGLMY